MAIVGLVTVVALSIVYVIGLLFLLLTQITGPGGLSLSGFLLTLLWPISIPLFALFVRD